MRLLFKQSINVAAVSLPDCTMREASVREMGSLIEQWLDKAVVTRQ